ncbi:MAG: desulfoferrodoxin [Candidatus Verstraetearchaeota archaeon]|nr:desulfoferrodoxin [Candidatus Verstraetearchaeota archaeon]
MTQRMEIYKCEICGNIVMVVHAGPGQLVCCGKPMKLMTEKTAEMGKEKHVPVIERTERGFKVKVGSTTHPMMPEHYIEWIEAWTDDAVTIKFLTPDDFPELELDTGKEVKKAREYCNIHNLWSSNK